jgi:hypothetical protein
MLSEYDRTWCTKLLATVTKWPISYPFLMPVDPIRDGAPNYLTIVKNPMDFGTMKKKLSESKYNSVQEFIDDIQLICDNAKLFNGSTSMYGLFCNDIMAEVHKQYSEKSNSVLEEWYKSLLQAIQDIERLLQEVPIEITTVESFESPSNLDQPKLSMIQKQVLIRLIGIVQTETLSQKWRFLNESARNQILSVIGHSMEQ